MIVLFLDPMLEFEWSVEFESIGLKLNTLRWLDRDQGVASLSLAPGELDLARQLGQMIWASDVWPESEVIEFASIRSAQNLLRERGRYWAHCTLENHRRGQLIASEMVNFPFKRSISGWPKAEVLRPGGFALKGSSEMLVCANPRDAFPGNSWTFTETKVPPSRAYLKLWEWGWRTNVRPVAGQSAVDLGSFPGGWTWVLLSNQLRVRAYDRVPFAQTFGRNGSLQFEKADAFDIGPREIEQPDWVFCDVIANAEKSLAHFEKWAAGSQSGLCFTLKLKGKDSGHLRGILDRIKYLTEGREPTLGRIHAAHLSVNKNELTIWRSPGVSN